MPFNSERLQCNQAWKKHSQLTTAIILYAALTFNREVF